MRAIARLGSMLLLLAACGSQPTTSIPAGGQTAAAPAALAAITAMPKTAGPSAAPTPGAEPPRILLFSKTTGFRHDSIPDAIAALQRLGAQRGFAVDATEDSASFTDEQLARYRAVVFLMTTGDVLDQAQQAAFERYIRAGNGYVGVHSASDTEYDWPWYGGLVGAYFSSHPAIQQASITIEDSTHPSTAGLTNPWIRTDEWYNFRANPRAHVHVLATLDETTYQGGTMGAAHPFAWYHDYDGGRAWYTAGGHTSASYAEPEFLQHLLGGLLYAAQLQISLLPAVLR